MGHASSILRKVQHSILCRVVNVRNSLRIIFFRVISSAKTVVETRVNKIALLVFARDSIGEQLAALKQFERVDSSYMKKRIPKNGVMLDVGANIGYWTTLFAASATEGRVYAFEPSPKTAILCEANSILNGFGTRVQLERYALAAQTGQQSFSIADDSGFSSFTATGRSTEQQTITVPTTTLDAYVKDHNISRIDFIKIDVEGGEYGVLQGGENIFARQLPRLILMELVDKNLQVYGASIEKILTWMHDHSYRPFVIDHVTGLERPYNSVDQNMIQNVYFAPYDDTKESIHTE